MVLAVNLPGAQCNRHGDGMDGKGREQLLDKLEPLCSTLFGVSARRANSSRVTTEMAISLFSAEPEMAVSICRAFRP